MIPLRRIFTSFSNLAAALLVLALPPGLAGCAFFNPDKTPLLNSVRDHLVPEDPVLHAVASPVIYPVGFAAVMADALVIHPATVIDDAARDAGDALWDHWYWDHRYVTECAKLPGRTLLTPLVFTGAFIARGYFDIPDAARDAREGREAAGAPMAPIDETLESARAAFEAGRFDEAIEMAQSVQERSESESRDWVTATVIVLESAFEAGRVDFLETGAFVCLRNGWPIDAERVDKLVERMLGSEDYRMRWQGILAARQGQNSPEQRAEFGKKHILSEPSAALRARWLIECCPHGHVGSSHPFRDLIEEIAENDPDPMNRVLAREILEASQR